MLNERQKNLLKLIVEEYIKTAKAISSNSLCEELDCSSATVRNEMSFLEEVGLLEKTHISSGRIPSEKGYRYYVDNIMQPKELTGDDVLKLQTIFHNNSLVLNDVIIRSMEIVGEMTNCAAVILGSSSSDNFISKVEVVPLDKNKIVALVITDKGHVESRTMFLESEISPEEIKQTVDIINKLIIGVSLDSVSAKLEYDVKPVITKYVKQHEVLYNAFYKAFSDIQGDYSSMKVSGTNNILAQPEFDSVSKIRELMKKFDDPNMIKNIKEDNEEIKVYIGSESSFDDDIGIIKTKYQIGDDFGTIAIIGPKRMEYDRVHSLLEYIKKNIGGNNG